jgi:anthranilate phosphoribosyltransferase
MMTPTPPDTSPTTAELEALLAGSLSDNEALALLAQLKPHTATQALVQRLWALLWAQRAEAFQSLTLPYPVVDTCGSGGSALGGFNTSTCAAMVLAAAGLPVVKFGNRSATGRSGSTDVLSALGLCPQRLSESWAATLADTNLAFLAAPVVYPGLGGPLATWRKQAGHPTLFNVLGPSLNPVQPAYRLMGQAFRVTLPLVAHLLAEQGLTKAAWVLRSHNGLDELHPTQPADGYLVQGRLVTALPWVPPPGLVAPAPNGQAPESSSPSGNAQRCQAMLAGDDCTSLAYQGVVLNAGAALWLAGRCADMAEGQALAATLLRQGAVTAVLTRLKRLASPR